MIILIGFLALIFLAAGLIFIYKPSWLLKFNQVARERVFNDLLVEGYRRRGAAFFFALSLIFSFWTFHSAQYSETELTKHFISSDRLLYQSLQHLYSRQYNESKSLSVRVLSREPQNAEALYQLAAAQFLMDDLKAAEANWLRAQKIRPNSAQAQRLKQLITQTKDFKSEALK